MKTHFSLSANNKEDTNHMLILGSSGISKSVFLGVLLFTLLLRLSTWILSLKNAGKDVRILGSCNGLRPKHIV